LYANLDKNHDIHHHQNEEIVLSTSNDTTFIRHDIAISTKKA